MYEHTDDAVVKAARLAFPALMAYDPPNQKPKQILPSSKYFVTIIIKVTIGRVETLQHFILLNLQYSEISKC